MRTVNEPIRFSDFLSLVLSARSLVRAFPFVVAVVGVSLIVVGGFVAAGGAN